MFHFFYHIFRIVYSCGDTLLQATTFFWLKINSENNLKSSFTGSLQISFLKRLKYKKCVANLYIYHIYTYILVHETYPTFISNQARVTLTLNEKRNKTWYYILQHRLAKTGASDKVKFWNFFNKLHESVQITSLSKFKSN